MKADLDLGPLGPRKIRQVEAKQAEVQVLGADRPALSCGWKVLSRSEAGGFPDSKLQKYSTVR